jgi:hypothetical protein
VFFLVGICRSRFLLEGCPGVAAAMEQDPQGSGSQQRSKTRGNFYVANRNRLEEQVARMRAQLQLLQDERSEAQARERVLLGLVEQQEALMEGLRGFMAGTHSVASSTIEAGADGRNNATANPPAQHSSGTPYVSPFHLSHQQLADLLGTDGGSLTDATKDARQGALASCPRAGYAFELLQKATPEQWEAATSMTAKVRPTDTLC